MILLILIQLVQDPTAVDALKKIQERIEKSTTIAFTLKQEIITPTRIVDSETGETLSSSLEKSERTGTVVFNENRCHLLFSEVFGSKKHDTDITSDGKNLIIKHQDIASVLRTPKNFRRNLDNMISWLGFSKPWEVLTGKEGEEPTDIHPNYLLGEIREIHAEAGSSLIEYKVIHRLHPNEVAFRAKVWFDPKTSHIIKRTMSSEKKNGWSITETFEDWVLDGKIEDPKTEPPRKREY